MKKKSTIKFFRMKLLLVTGLVLVAMNSFVFAANGKITGRVTDKETGEPLPAATVVITHVVAADGREVPLPKTRGAATDADGYYFIMNVEPGVYTLKASIIGYQATVQKGVRVDLDRTITANFQLGTTAIQTEQITVVAPREIIKQDVSGTQEVVASARIEQMPVLRLDEFMGRIKGVELVSNSEGNGLSVRGGNIRETDVRLDGISLQDPRSGNSYIALNSTTIQQVQVLTGGFEAKYGGIQSGLLNVVTKDGQRDRYTVSLKMDVAPAGQRRYFGTNPYSDSSWIYKVYAGQYAMSGVTKADQTVVPKDFWNFPGWVKARTMGAYSKQIGMFTPDQILGLWKAQHPQYNYQNKPDYYFEGSLTGPVPGEWVPLYGEFAKRSTFLLGFKYENSQFAFPLGGRDHYLDWNGQLKVTTQLQENMRLSVNGMFANISTLSGGSKTSFGGALSDEASSFGFLNSTESSVRSQAALLGGASSDQIFNLSRLQFFDQKYIVGGARLTHTLSAKAFYTLDFQMGYTDQNLQPFRADTSNPNFWYSMYSDVTKKTYRFPLPIYGSPNASTNYGTDPLGNYKLYGGTQRVDSSYTTTFQLKGDFTAQIGRHNQLDAGFSARLEDFFVYTGTWYQSQLAYTPDTWQYLKSNPLQVGLYAQDKLEFEGMILNAGLRVDYFNPFKKGFQVGFPESEEYARMMNDIYPNLPGDPMSYERWAAYRDLIANPPGWPRTNNQSQIYLSPRLGVSFPITEASKMYFNYGTFYQRQPMSFLYDTYTVLGGVTVPTPGLLMEKTTSYEFGYEQMMFADLIANVTAYYKDISNRALARTYVNWYEDNNVTEYVPDGYKDIRGVELRLEKSVGRFVTFNAMYDYMVASSGQSGLATIYENLVKYKDNAARYAGVYSSVPLPRANVNLNLHTPSDLGEGFYGLNYLIGDLYADFFFEWRSGGRTLLNSVEQDPSLWIYAENVNYWNIDFRASKAFNTSFGSLELVFTVKNLTNNKWLSIGNMTQNQYDAYKKSLKTPDKGGTDKIGQYKSDDNHIDTGWLEAPIFLNPRRILFGLRINI
ncbi:MAG TPA: TonB-dependent receptor [Ignavibacteriales bacterium]|nr:TonB-dependent receptor [Ignavibacteriales bacterium]